MANREQAEAAGPHGSDREFWVGIGRAFGGAIFFSLPLLMTMEMWRLGFYMDRFRLALFILAMVPMLGVLDYFSGFKQTDSWWEDAVDGMSAYGVGFAAAAVVLGLFNVLHPGQAVGEVVGKVALQAVPASFGAVLANSQLGAHGAEARQMEERKRRAGYRAELFFMVAGAVFLAFNLAPTEEMVLIALRMTPGHALGLLAASLLMMHAFVFAAGFRGTPEHPEGTSAWLLFLRFTVVGYALALLVSAYVLWTFGRFAGASPALFVMQTVVLAFPASLGAAAARLIL